MRGSCIGLLVLSSLIFISLSLTACTPTCKNPYIEYKKGDCCLDSNNDKICDKDALSADTSLTDAAVQPIKAEPSKPVCPYECCIGDEYGTKPCSEGHKCEQNSCIEVDSDKDGLSDIEEKKYGTNLHLSDTDGDGWSDTIEIRTQNTDPLNPNTDSDRYVDSEDSNPLKPNSAIVSVNVERVDTSNEGLKLITKSVSAVGSASLGDIPATANYVSDIYDIIDRADLRTLKFTIDNDGDDYTAHTRFDLYVEYEYKKDDNLIAKKNIFIKSYKVNEKVESYRTIERADVLRKSTLQEYVDSQLPTPEECTGLFSFCDEYATYNVQNVQYETYD